MGTTVTLKGVVIQFPHLFSPHTPKSLPNAKPAHGAQFLAPQEHPDLPAMYAAVEAAKAEKFPTGMPPTAGVCTNWPDPRHTPEHMQQWVCVTARNDVERNPMRRDRIIGPDMQPIVSPQDIFSGCIVNVVLDVYGYQTGKGGVTCSIDAIQLVANQNVERLDGVVVQDVTTLFQATDGSQVSFGGGGSIGTPAAAAAAGRPMPGGPPPQQGPTGLGPQQFVPQQPQQPQPQQQPQQQFAQPQQFTPQPGQQQPQPQQFVQPGQPQPQQFVQPGQPQPQQFASPGQPQPQQFASPGQPGSPGAMPASPQPQQGVAPGSTFPVQEGAVPQTWDPPPAG